MTDASHAPPRAGNPLRLRRPAEIAWAYVLGTTAGLTALFVLMLLAGVLDPSHAFARAARMSLAFFFIYLLIFGGLVCLAVELVVVTPLLVGFHRYRWRWLNGWTGALIGFTLAFTPAFLLAALAPTRGPRPGWVELVAASAAIGVVGLVAAGVFRLLAVRTAAPGEP